MSAAPAFSTAISALSNILITAPSVCRSILTIAFVSMSLQSLRSWSTLTEDYFLKNPSEDALRLVLQLIDIRTGPTDDDIMMINFMVENEIPFEVVATKTDKLSKAQLAAALADMEENVFRGTGIQPIPFSAVSGNGRDTLIRMIEEAIDG